MSQLLVIGCSLAGAMLGGAFGLYLGFQEGGDFNIAPALYGPTGAAFGAVGGCVVGVVAFG